MVKKRIAVLSPVGRVRNLREVKSRVRRLESQWVAELCHVLEVSEIARARTLLAAELLPRCGAFDYVLMVDDDIEFFPRDVETLLFSVDAHSSIPHLGWYRIRSVDGCDNRVSVKRYCHSDGSCWWVGGLGFCAMTSQVFRRLHEPKGDDWIVVHRELSPVRGLYSSGPHGHSWRSEDICFCNFARPCVSPRSVVAHAGRMPGPYFSLLDGAVPIPEMLSVTKLCE